MSRKRKRPPIRTAAIQPKNGSGTDDDVIPCTIRALMGTDATIFPLFDFVREYAPNLSVVEPSEDTPDCIRLRKTLVCPSRSITPSSCRKVGCIESLPSLVDDVIWSLVQRRSVDKTRNVLSHGYVSATENLSQTLDVRPCPQMRPGVLCTHMNDNVSFIKTSSFGKTLHKLVGDDILRTILLNTSLFLPVEQDWDNPKLNYLLLCGPPLQPRAGSLLKRKPTQMCNSKHDQLSDKRRKTHDKTEPQTADIKKQWNPNAIVPRHSLFYSGSFVPKVGLPSTHILNQQPPKYGLLLSAMLDCHSNKGRKRWKRVRELGIGVCQQIFRRHASCDYHRLLDRYCPLPHFCRGSRDPNSLDTTSAAQGDEEVTLPQLSAAHCPSDGVVSFLRAVLRHVFPPEFWGTEHNLEAVLAVTETFVKLRRKEQLPNKALMNGIRVKDFRWVYGSDAGSSKNVKKASWSKTLHEAATIRVRNVMNWLFVHYIIPLLRSTFYVTESEFSANRVLYYRKPVWSLFRSLSMKKLLVRQYTEISRKEASARLIHQKMGFSKLRLLPKKSGVRAVATLSKREYAEFEKGRDTDLVPVSVNTKSDGDSDLPPKKRAKRDGNVGPMTLKPMAATRRRTLEKRFCSTNSILKDVFEVLRHEKGRHPDLFGSGVFGLNEVYPKYRCFLEQYRQLCASAPRSGSCRLYFATVDINQCYDNINQKHLLDILPNLLSEGEYLIQNYSAVHPFKSLGRVLKKQVKRVGPPASYIPFQEAVGSLASDYNESVFMNGARCTLVRKEDVMDLLQEHLRSHVVIVRGRYGDRFLLQSTGIPQGSVLSTLLCNYYYGDVEKILLGNEAGLSPDGGTPRADGSESTLNGHATLLVRIVDDFLLITTDRELSTKFLDVMSDGNDELGVHINKDKTLVSDGDVLGNSDTMAESRSCSVVAPNEDGHTVFPWCGMLFDCENGEVRVDYSRFSDGKATDALTVDRSGGEGLRLEIRMKSFVRPRCHPMLFDSRINCAQTVGVNFTQLILLCAVKTAGYVVEGMNGGTQKNGDHLARCVDDVIAYAHKLIAERLRQENAASSDASRSSQDGFLELKRKDAMWLGWNAFRSIFNRVRGCDNFLTLIDSKCRSSREVSPTLQTILNVAIQQFSTQMAFNFES